MPIREILVSVTGLLTELPLAIPAFTCDREGSESCEMVFEVLEMGVMGFPDGGCFEATVPEATQGFEGFICRELCLCDMVHSWICLPILVFIFLDLVMEMSGENKKGILFTYVHSMLHDGQLLSSSGDSLM